ncbi:hypothetical protein STSP2_00256 [Anaerohalosphaera lusitana]|uniref:Uncharacterized protein n=1 Tax=Anaerohalosphaera lusitana TaxID=1936003 RepID=A0A1U9NH36_9BACT|nr:hypothetical protein [Anaerohalosphaera lusitana]AQT67115.1 hypothetical protein STSP2_00256 [Anaerohalosphaera lusitana]
MEMICRDADLVRYEPVLFGDCGIVSQTICGGEGGVIAGTSFTVAGADFVSGGVEAGQVVHLYSAEEGIDGVFEIVEVAGAEELMISVIRADDENGAICDVVGSEVRYSIVSYAAQIRDVTFELTKYFGLGPGDSSSEYGLADVIDTGDLRRACVFAVLAGIYATLGRQAGDASGHWEKSLFYQRKFERAREACRIELDSDGDGVGEAEISGGGFRLRRG